MTNKAMAPKPGTSTYLRPTVSRRSPRSIDKEMTRLEHREYDKKNDEQAKVARAQVRKAIKQLGIRAK